MNRPFVWIIGGVVGLGLVVLLAISIVAEEERDTSIGYGQVEVLGDPIPILGDQGDVAIGFPAPAVTGADWNGIGHSIEADGRPKIIIFLAHWCQFCQAEVPVVQSWIDAGNLPEDVDMYGVTTSTDPLRPNWPPQDWLEEEGWTVPTIMDDNIGTVSVAYGMRGTPFYAVLDGNNVNLQRVSGAIGIQGLEALVDIAQASAG
jgi:thiol-disulfide isomerase/thioredoxin